MVLFEGDAEKSQLLRFSGELVTLAPEKSPAWRRIRTSRFVVTCCCLLSTAELLPLLAGVSFFSGESLFLIRCSGHGDLWFNTYGALLEVDVTGDYVVDTGHIVAFTDGLDYSVTKVGGYKSLFLSGEGLVCRFRGEGKVWIQSRKAPAFIWWANAFRPVKSRG